MFRRWFRCALVPAAFIAAALAGFGQEPTRKPYHDPRNDTLVYNGPGRDDPEARSVREVRIAYFGPGDVSHPEGGEMWAGAALAVEEANAHGGYSGIPFRLVPAWTDDPWRGGVAQLARLASDESVWAIIGGIDGATTHLAEQLLPKALLALVNPAATDRSIHAAGVPWVFSCAPGDHLQAAEISRELKQRATGFVLISAVDHDSRAYVTQLKLAFARDRLSPSLHLEWNGREDEAARIAGQAAASAPGIAVVAAGTRGGVALIRALRKAGFRGAMISGPWIACAGSDPSLRGVLYPSLGDIAPEFRSRFGTRYGRDPDYTAAHAFDAVNIVVAAVRNAGLNRARIRDEIRALSPVQGVTGTIAWDPAGQNCRPVKLVAMP
jgi:branched-chain amino acid transport system substrate-binding protein